MVRRNLIASYSGQIFASLCNFIFAPIYMRLMGPEAFGLVGFFTTVIAAAQLLDLGLSPTMTRELARLSANDSDAQTTRDYVRTVEIGYWVIGVIIAAALVPAARIIATRWVRPQHLSPSTVITSIALIGIATALQWPLSLYSGGLTGLQRQVLLQSFNGTAAVVRGVGSIIALLMTSRSIIAFFVWQAVFSALQTVTITILLWRNLPRGDRPARFRRDLFARTYHFAFGMAGIGLVTFALAQVDKIILSKLLTLEMFGYYALASIAGYGLQVLVTPAFNAIFPTLSKLVAQDARQEVASLYHVGSQLVSVVVIPMSLVIASFAMQVMTIWTADATTAANTHGIMTALVIATMLNSVVTIPLALQLAYGWTRVVFWVGILRIVMIVPLIILLTPRYGPVAAAWTVVIANAIGAVITMLLVHRRLLRDEGGEWFIHDLALPFLAAASIVVLARAILSVPHGVFASLFFLAIVFAASLSAAIAAAPLVRSRLLTGIRSVLRTAA